MSEQLLRQTDADRLRALYRNLPAPIPSDIRLIDGRILTFKTHQDRRASAENLYKIDHHLSVDYDGRPDTVEVGVTGPDSDVSAVIVLKQGQLWKDQEA